MKQFFSLMCVLLAAQFIAQAQTTTVTFGKEEVTKKYGGSTNIFLGRVGDDLYELRIEGVGGLAAQNALLMDNPGMGLGMAMLIGVGVIDEDRRLYDLESYMSAQTGSMFTKATYFIEVIGADGNRKSSTEIKMTNGDEQLKLKNIVMLNDVFHVFATYFDKKNYKTTLYHTTLNADGTMNTKFDVLMTTTGKNKAMENMWGTNSFRVIPSSDHSKVLVYYSLWNDKSVPESVMMKMYDNAMKEVWNHDYHPSIGESRFVFAKDIVTNNGDVYLLAKQTASSEEKKEGAKSFRFVLMKAGQNLPSLKTLEVKVPDKLVTDVYVNQEADNSLDLLGFFSEASSKKAGGTYIMKISPAFVITKNTSKAFTTQTIQDILGEDEGSDKSELGNIHVRKAFVNGDGTFTLACENYQILVSSNNGGFSFSYRYFDIPVFRVKDDASVVWATAVKKRQKSSNDGAFNLSYLVHKSGDNLQIIFNGHKEDPKRMMYDVDNSAPYVVTIDKDGKQTINKLFTSKENDYAVVPRTSYMYDDNKIMLYGVRGLKYRFMRVDL